MHYGFIFFFFFNDTATTEIYTLSLHDALPIRPKTIRAASSGSRNSARKTIDVGATGPDRKSTRLNSSHSSISYAVFCLKKKNQEENSPQHINNAHNTVNSP